MGVFKVFGKKASTVSHFGKKMAKGAYFGAKRGAKVAASYGQPVANIATAAAALAMGLGQPEVAVPLIGLAKGAAKASHYGKALGKDIEGVERVVKGLQKQGRKAKGSGFEQAPQAPPARGEAQGGFESGGGSVSRRSIFGF